MLDEWRRRWREGRETWKELRRFEALPRSARRIVFYAETAADWAHLGPAAAALQRRGSRVLRVTSDRRDAVLLQPDAFFVGSGSARTVFFRSVEADTVVMTLTDLEQFHLKRSAHPVHYFYVFHSMASTHRVYREHAFDAYDSILCVGPHHFTEIRRMEEVYGLPPKRLLEHGYGRLDTLLAEVRSRGTVERAGEVPRVLLAPSWGESSMVEHCLDAVIDVLLGAGFHISLRVHPMTARHRPQLTAQLVTRHAATGRFHFDPDVSTTEALLAADVMISEWSGAPLEFAFARERPVIFIDTPPKIHNPRHDRIALPALEADIRAEIGRIVALHEIGTLPEIVCELAAEGTEWGPRIARVRERTVFNIGRSGEVAAEHILGTLQSMRSGDV
ncbi:MAG TPA: CDP-glycerol glycerophosphotransferase family protein [Thermoanaerobaculia bacterium]|nr:CDP-glycerol glycerophosphotransferase family protein [Thermoanaerobaculia bacterium]